MNILESKDLFITSIASAIAFLFLSACIIIIILWDQKRKHKDKAKILDLNNKAEQMKTKFQQAILQTQIEIQEQTLKTISQEIHDNIGQVLSLAKLNLNTLQPNETEKLSDTKQLVSKAINDLRDLSRSLHGDRIAELGLQESIANELKILQNTGQFQTKLYVVGESYKLEPQKEMVIFRIVQEAVNNVVKHAKAKHIDIRILYRTDIFDLSIADDGIGFNTNSISPEKSGIGLHSMQNRAALIGAELTINSISGNGTEINMKLKRA